VPACLDRQALSCRSTSNESDEKEGRKEDSSPSFASGTDGTTPTASRDKAKAEAGMVAVWKVIKENRGKETRGKETRGNETGESDLVYVCYL